MLTIGCSTWSSFEKKAVDAYNGAHQLHQAGKLDAAIELYRQALIYQPKMAMASYNLVLALSENDSYDEALEILQKLQVRDPLNLTILRTIGWVMRQKGDITGALTHYNAVLLIFEGDKLSLKAVVDIYDKAQEYEAAIEYQKTLMLYDKSMETRLKLAELYEQNEMPLEALKEYRWVAAQSSASPGTLLAAGEMAEAGNLYQEAVSYYLQLTKTDTGEEARAWFNLGRLRLLEFIDFRGGIDALKNAFDRGFNDDEQIYKLMLEVQPELIPAIQDMIDKQQESNGTDPPPEQPLEDIGVPTENANILAEDADTPAEEDSVEANENL